MMQRRTFLSLTLALTTGALFTGCGGGGGGGTSALVLVDTRSVTTLPPGFSLPLSELHGLTAFATASLQADATFATKLNAASPLQLAFLQHLPTGKFTLLGFVGEGQAGISAKGTAVALLGLSLGILGLPLSLQQQAIAALETTPATGVLADVIASRVAANPFAVFEPDAQIVSALKVAFDAVSKITRAVPLGDSSRLVPILGITPGDQSFARVLQTEDGQGLIPVNLGRRPVAVYTYKTGNQDSAGNQRMLAKALRIDGPQDLDAITSWIGSTFSLGSKPAWAPVSGKAIGLTMDANSTKTYYETVILMASGKTDQDPNPSFFSQAIYATERAEWDAARARLNKHAWISGILFDLVKSALGGALTGLSIAGVNSVLAELEAVETAATSKVLDFAARGYYGKATQLLMERVIGSGIISGQTQTALIRMVFPQAEAAGIAALRSQMGLALVGLAELVLGILAAAGTVLALGDLATTYSDVLSSEKAALWKETLLLPKVTLNPTNSDIAAGEDVVYSASAVGIEDGNTEVTYKWSIGGSNLATLSERDWVGKPNVGTQITTKTRVVTLSTTPSTQGTLTVTVEGWITRNGQQESLGTATATVKINTKKRLVYGRYATKVYEAETYARAYVVVPRSADAASYNVTAYGFNDTAYYGKQLQFNYPEPPGLPLADSWGGGKFQTSTEIWHGLSAGSSWNPSEYIPYLDQRFAGMIVKVVVNLK